MNQHSIAVFFLFALTLMRIVFGTSLPFKYHTNEELVKVLQGFEKTADKELKVKVYSIGNTTKGNGLWVIKLNATKEHRLGVPNIKLIGNIHGNEAVGREVLLHFVDDLINTKNESVAWLLNNAIIHILPSLNPDGFAMAEVGCDPNIGRKNAKDVDLNRNFPDYFVENTDPQAVETKAVINWMNDVPFVLSASLHAGALVASYPYDNTKEKLTITPPNLTPDNDVFQHLAEVYALNHKTMYKGNVCGSTQFRKGTVNGANWYTVTGGMQDYNYIKHGCMELTLEISCCKYPPAKELKQLWDENKSSIFKYSEQALRGVTGQIIDEITRLPIAGAKLEILKKNVAHSMPFKSFKTGEFWRLLRPGNYKIKIQAEGYYEKTVEFKVKKYNRRPKLTFLTIPLMNSSYSTTTPAPTRTPAPKLSSGSSKDRSLDKDSNSIIAARMAESFHTSTNNRSSGEPVAQAVMNSGNEMHFKLCSIVVLQIMIFLLLSIAFGF